MRVPAQPVVGREDELSAARRFVADFASGPAALVFEGVAGIGKTVIWSAAVQDAARVGGVAVRAVRCGESDATWTYAGLGDLFDDLDAGARSALPAVQQRALESALLLSDQVADHRVVGVAVLGVLRQLSTSGTLLLAIDDVQWLDPSTRSVLSFALRRLTDEPIRLITSFRTGGPADAAGPPDLGLPSERRPVGSVSIGVLQRIVQARADVIVSRPTLTRLHQATGGNPLLCLEMIRAMHRRGREPAVDEPLPVPADLRLLVTERLLPLSWPARQLLLLAGAMARPTAATVTAASADPAVAADAFAELITAGLVEFDGERVHFTHPLIASIPYADLAPTDRRGLHQRLAASVSDPEERARHAALGSLEPSAAVAGELDAAARYARRRGSIDAAAELAELAVTHTPSGDADGLLRRSADAAEYLLLLGETARAWMLLRFGLDAAPPGPARVRGLLLGATIASWQSGDATVADRCHQAMREAGDDVLLRARCHATLADTSPSGAATDLYHAEQAVALLETTAAPPVDVLANALTNLAVNACRLGRGLAVAMLERADALQAAAPPVPVNDRAALGLGMYLKVVDRFDESRTWLRAVRTAAVDEGDDSALPNVLGHLATLECWAGRYDVALAHAVEGRESSTRTGLRSPMTTSAHVLTLAYLGRVDEARVLGETDLAEDEALGFDAAGALHRRSLGVVALMDGDAAGAAAHFTRALAISVDEVGIREPAILRAHADAVAVLVAVGRLDEAERLTDQLDTSTRANNRPWSTVMAARCHAVLRSARGEQASALELFESALIEHRRLPMPFEEASTRMLYANLLRRGGHRGDARGQYAAAREVFVRLGTPIQVRRADLELASLGGRTASDGLTAVEWRVAELAGDGAANREIAVALFVSVRTVESHLGRIYRKLGVRSRTELAKLRGSTDARG
jgi:DNA-binding CsgD family transcriptional regulator